MYLLLHEKIPGRSAAARGERLAHSYRSWENHFRGELHRCLDKLCERVWNKAFNWIVADRVEPLTTQERIGIRQAVVRDTVALIDTRIMQKDPGMLLYRDSIPPKTTPPADTQTEPEPEKDEMSPEEKAEFVKDLKRDLLTLKAGAKKEVVSYVAKILECSGAVPALLSLSTADLKKIRDKVDKDSKP